MLLNHFLFKFILNLLYLHLHAYTYNNRNNYLFLTDIFHSILLYNRLNLFSYLKNQTSIIFQANKIKYFQFFTCLTDSESDFMQKNYERKMQTFFEGYLTCIHVRF